MEGILKLNFDVSFIREQKDVDWWFKKGLNKSQVIAMLIGFVSFIECKPIMP